MDFLLVTVLSFGIFVEYNAQPAGNLNFACRNEEEYDMCRSPCEPTCENIKSGTRRNCSQSCVAGCFCREGLVRATDRSCILPEECNTRIRPVCKENEEFRECGSPCVVNCSNINDPIFCTKPCHSGCFCKQDFVRDSKGNCVHQRNCYKGGHKQCPLNEHYVNCINFCNMCWESGECRSHYCTPGCDCKPGLYRNFYGQCVTEEECLTPFYDNPYPNFRGYCGENEIYTDCVNLCNDCVFKGRCNFEYYCEPGCDCKSGHFRNDRGICVPEQFCFRKRPVCPLDEQYYSCIPTCRSTCDTYGDSRAICDTSCTPGCFCKAGQIRRNDGKCVSPRNCPERPVCPPDEQYYSCIPTCRSTCETYSDSRSNCDTSCKSGCFCKAGQIRRNDGKCVSPRDCIARNPTCPRGEAFYQCLPTCRTTCETLNTASGLCPIECRPGCFCQPGFVRNTNGRCVQPKDCEDYTTPENASFDPRRGGADNEDMADLTTATTPITTEDNQSVTDKPTQKDNQSPTSTFPVTTPLTTPAITNNVSAATAPVTSITDLTSAAVDPVTLATDLASTADPVTLATDLATSTTDPLTLATDLASPVTKVTTTSNINSSENPTPTESTTLKESSTISSRNTQAAETSIIPTVEQTLTTKVDNAQITTINMSTDATATESDISLNSTTVQP